MKTFKKFSMEVKKMDDPELGIPKWCMISEMPGIEPEQLFDLFDKKLKGKILIKHFTKPPSLNL
jgi:hypothetical protein